MAVNISLMYQISLKRRHTDGVPLRVVREREEEKEKKRLDNN